MNQSFVLQPDLFLAYPVNRAFVEGRAVHPPLWEYWLGLGVSALISLTLLAIGLGFVPIPFSDDLSFLRWLLSALGFISLVGDLFLLSITIRLRNGQLLEGRVKEADLRPHPSRPRVMMQYIYIEFRDPDGQAHVVLRRRKHRDDLALPVVGTQAAILYASPNILRLL